MFSTFGGRDPGAGPLGDSAGIVDKFAPIMGTTFVGSPVTLVVPTRGKPWVGPTEGAKVGLERGFVINVNL